MTYVFGGVDVVFKRSFVILVLPSSYEICMCLIFRLYSRTGDHSTADPWYNPWFLAAIWETLL